MCLKRSEGHVPEAVKLERFDRLMSRQLEISREINQKHIGKTLQVLIDGFAGGDTSQLFGRTAFQAPEIDGVVNIDENTADPGRLVDVRISGAGDYDSRGTIV